MIKSSRKRVVVTVSAQHPRHATPFLVQRFHSVEPQHADRVAQAARSRMAQNLQLDLDAIDVTTSKPKRSYHPQFPKSGLNAKEYNEGRAIEYAKWLARRDGVTLPAGQCKARCEWSGFNSAYRMRNQSFYDGTREVTQFCNRIRYVLWGWEEDQFSTRKDGRRGAYIGKKFNEEARIEIPHWDFEALPPIEEIAAPSVRRDWLHVATEAFLQ